MHELHLFGKKKQFPSGVQYSVRSAKLYHGQYPQGVYTKEIDESLHRLSPGTIQKKLKRQDYKSAILDFMLLGKRRISTLYSLKIT